MQQQQILDILDIMLRLLCHNSRCLLFKRPIKLQHYQSGCRFITYLPSFTLKTTQICLKVFKSGTGNKWKKNLILVVYF